MVLECNLWVTSPYIIRNHSFVTFQDIGQVNWVNSIVRGTEEKNKISRWCTVYLQLVLASRMHIWGHSKKVIIYAFAHQPIRIELPLQEFPGRQFFTLGSRMIQNLLWCDFTVAGAREMLQAIQMDTFIQFKVGAALISSISSSVAKVCLPMCTDYKISHH
jgi:hypothetical protein